MLIIRRVNIDIRLIINLIIKAKRAHFLIKDN